ncbi:hypothetical protein MTO96_011495 [Rhipicephalus appendiculatus]
MKFTGGQSGGQVPEAGSTLGHARRWEGTVDAGLARWVRCQPQPGTRLRVEVVHREHAWCLPCWPRTLARARCCGRQTRLAGKSWRRFDHARLEVLGRRVWPQVGACSDLESATREVTAPAPWFFDVQPRLTASSPSPSVSHGRVP